MCLNPLKIIVKDKETGQDFERIVRCGKCVECKQQYSTDWAYRVMLETKKHSSNCFITLTYNEDNLPPGASLRKRDLQLFFKRLRKQLSADAIKVRYFACGEYGSQHDRPHYHIILFGCNFPDKWFFRKDNKGNSLYRSELLEKVWTQGFSSIGEISFETAKYCAKYLSVDKDFLPKDKEPTFTLMSRRPGIALDCVPDSVYQEGVLYFEGRRVKAPKAFLKVVEREFPEQYKNIKWKTAPLSERIRLEYFDEDEYKQWLKFFRYDGSDKTLKRFWDMLKAEAYRICWKDKSLEELYLSAKEQEDRQKQEDLEKRRKKVKKIFGKTIDNFYRPMVSFKKKIKSIVKKRR